MSTRAFASCGRQWRGDWKTDNVQRTIKEIKNIRSTKTQYSCLPIFSLTEMIWSKVLSEISEEKNIYLFLVKLLIDSIWLTVIMRPSSLGGGCILRRTLSVCLSVRPVRGSSFVIGQRQPCGRAVSFVLFTCAGRIKYGDQPHKLVHVIDHKARTRNYYMCIVHDIKTTQTTSISLCLASVLPRV